MIVEIDGGALLIRCRNDAKAEKLMLDCLAFCITCTTSSFNHSLFLGILELEGEVPDPSGTSPISQARGL